MNYLLNIALVVNFILILIFLLDIIVIKKNLFTPRIKGDISAILVFFFILYLGLICIYIFLNMTIIHSFKGLLLIFYIVAPFVIGKYAKYKTLMKYSVIQLLCFISSFITLLFLK